ncbi:MAG: DNA topoisomerase (ATP-hydrolyzing) subunit A [Candidatus Thalassarchaeum sp.]|jgi:DNA gyrase subunit A|nr:DNA topoisomerase (ATP-hydrolyzing) subunit A [Candidatus Thalassarchaeum sp.]MDP6920521.1 DNA topoisomerase (ATP-hydrolyzing) subunit A [Candidatus Thalassarchaeum sp.]MEE3277941.1 DNA topoisomerase (ATP-hydrolyzing) subunit A [Candidatus Thermoplasmatota archaeon]
MAEDLLRRDISDEMKESYINYAMSVIIGRALPDVRDGLKPVHRRILWGMHQAGHTHEKGYSKSARSVGEVMGKYHPHGDQALYDTMVRMAQDFSLRYPLIDGQGNFGSIDGDPPAAMRYTESRLDRMSQHMLDDINKNTIDMEPNFDDTETEPAVLPSRLPNLLLNGSDGIAVGMATKIPPHNLNEVAAAIKFHVEKVIEQNRKIGLDNPPKIDALEYMEFLRGPDFPTGATIHGIDGIVDMYRTGNGRFHIRSDVEVLDDSSGKRLIIHSIPYQVKKAGMLQGIAELVQKETIKGIRDIRDESSKEGIRVVIEIKQNADPHAVLNQLYQSSRLQESYSANMMGILKGEPVQLDLCTILHTHVRHRETVIERRTQFDLDKAQARAHILEGLMKAQKRMAEIIEVGRNSDSREQFEQYLRGEEKYPKVKRFDFSEKQAKAIAERRLYQLTKMNVQEVSDELEKLKQAIKDLKGILGSRIQRLEIIISELEEVVERHGDERRSSIDPTPLSMDREDLVAEEAFVISLTQDNYIRHLPVEAFRLQNRGGKGLKGVATKEEDAPSKIVTCFSKDRLLIFTDMGRVYGLRAWETPSASRHGRGSHIRNLLGGIRDDEKVISILPLSRELIENPEDNYLMFATTNGRIKKSRLSEYVKINRNGKYALRFAEGEKDSLVTVRSASDADHVVLVSSQGNACRFMPAEEKSRVDPNSGETMTTHLVRAQGRVSQGVSGMKLRKGDRVIGMIVTDDFDTSVLTISKYGMAKRSRLGSGEMVVALDDEGKEMVDEDGGAIMVRDGYRRTNRGTKGVRTMSLRDDDRIVSVRQIPDLDDQLFMLTGTGMMIRMVSGQTKETLGKVTKGTRIMELRNADRSGYADEIIFVARLPADLVDSSDADEPTLEEE